MMKKLLMAAAVVAVAASPALAAQCPLLHKQMEAAVGTRADAGAANAKALMAEGDALHKGGKHADSVKKYQDAAKAAGVELKMK